MAGAVLSRGQVHIWRQAQGAVQLSQQAQRFHKVRYRFRGKRRTFPRYRLRSRYRFAAGAALSQGKAPDFAALARSGTDFAAGAFSQAVKKKIQRYNHKEK